MPNGLATCTIGHNLYLYNYKGSKYELKQSYARFQLLMVLFLMLMHIKNIDDRGINFK